MALILLHLMCHRDVNYNAFYSTVLSSRIRVHLLWILHSCRHISVCSVLRKADTEWCIYRCLDINPAVSLSCCYQFMSCENEMVTWDPYFLHWLYTLLRGCEVIFFPYCRAHFKYTDSDKKGPAGVATTFNIHRGHADYNLVIDISLLLGWFVFKFHSHICCTRVLAEMHYIYFIK